MWRESVRPLFNKVQGQHLKNQVGHNFGHVSRFDIIPRDSKACSAPKGPELGRSRPFEGNSVPG
jgi:hypothetical protein